MTDFKRICYRAVIEFLTMENASPQQIQNQMIVVYGEDARRRSERIHPIIFTQDKGEMYNLQ